VEPRGFEELAVYQRSAALADEIRVAVRAWNPLDRWSSGIQTIRANALIRSFKRSGRIPTS